jgi:hypothetical protein
MTALQIELILRDVLDKTQIIKHRRAGDISRRTNWNLSRKPLRGKRGDIELGLLPAQDL